MHDSLIFLNKLFLSIDQESNPPPFGVWTTVQPTEPYQPGRESLIFETLSENTFNFLFLMIKTFDWKHNCSLNVFFTENSECIALWCSSFR